MMEEANKPECTFSRALRARTRRTQIKPPSYGIPSTPLDRYDLEQFPPFYRSWQALSSA